MLRRMNRDDLTAHGFRSTLGDWAAETTGYANEVVEKALAHVLPDATEAVYRRGDMLERRRPRVLETASAKLLAHVLSSMVTEGWSADSWGIP